ncbi:MAG TPA: transposase family protein, partial [Polyangia bacterium]
MEARTIRRHAGLMQARLAELGLATVPDPRQSQWCRWRLPVLLRVGLTALMAGCRSLAEVERLTTTLTPAARSLLGLTRRVPDTTLRDAYGKVDPATLRPVMARQCLAAHRRKALAPHRLPFGVVAMDGKATAGDGWDMHYAQKQTHSSDGGASGVVRTITCCLVSAPA